MRPDGRLILMAAPDISSSETSDQRTDPIGSAHGLGAGMGAPEIWNSETGDQRTAPTGSAPSDPPGGN